MMFLFHHPRTLLGPTGLATGRDIPRDSTFIFQGLGTSGPDPKRPGRAKPKENMQGWPKYTLCLSPAARESPEAAVQFSTRTLAKA
eukprot:438193-Prorocentrum_minimum.AAC.1